MKIFILVAALFSASVSALDFSVTCDKGANTEDVALFDLSTGFPVEVARSPDCNFVLSKPDDTTFVAVYLVGYRGSAYGDPSEVATWQPDLPPVEFPLIPGKPVMIRLEVIQ